jgi:hypothetical protein
MIRSLLQRLKKLEENAIARDGPWPPERHTLSFHMWDAIGRPEERLSMLDMLLKRSEMVWRDHKCISET